MKNTAGNTQSKRTHRPALGLLVALLLFLLLPTGALGGEVEKHTITLSLEDDTIASWGSVSADKTEAAVGEEVTLTATPTPGGMFRFVQWYSGDIGGHANFYDNPQVFEMPDQEVHVNARFEKKITLAVNNAAWGSIIEGTEVWATYVPSEIVIAIPATGYEFVRWDVSGGASVSNNASADTLIAVSLDATPNSATAIFAPKKYDVTVVDGQSAWGTVSADKTSAAAGETVTLTANLADDDIFRVNSWRVLGYDNDDLQYGNPLVFEMPGQTVEANVTIEKKITLAVNNAAWGRIREGTEVWIDDAITILLAIPETGYEFVRWDVSGGALVLDNASADAFIAASRDTTPNSATAIFAPKTFNVTVQANDGAMGTVSNAPGTIDMGEIGTFTATPNTGYVLKDVSFVNADQSTSILIDGGPVSFTPTGEGDITATVTFAPREYNVTAETIPGYESWGSAATDKAAAAKGERVTLTAVPASDMFRFNQWVNNGGNVTDLNLFTNPSTFTMPGEDVDIRVVFSKKVTGKVNNEDWGEIRLGVDWNGSYGWVFANGGSAQATPKTGYVLERWETENITSNDKPDGSLQIWHSLNAQASSVKAIFAPDTFAVSIEASDNDMGTVSGGDVTLDMEGIGTFTAIPKDGYVLVGVQLENAKLVGDVPKEGGTISFTPTGEGDVTVTALFAPIEGHLITARSTDEHVGTVSGGGSFNLGETVTVTAKYVSKKAGLFIEWQKNGEPVSTNMTYTFLVDGDADLRAVFVENDKLASWQYGVIDKLQEAMPWYGQLLTPGRHIAWEQEDEAGYEGFLAKLLLYYYTHDHYEAEAFDLSALELPEDGDELAAFLSEYAADYLEGTEPAKGSEAADEAAPTLTEIGRTDWLALVEDKENREAVVALVAEHLREITERE